MKVDIKSHWLKISIDSQVKRRNVYCFSFILNLGDISYRNIHLTSINTFTPLKAEYCVPKSSTFLNKLIDWFY